MTTLTAEQKQAAAVVAAQWATWQAWQQQPSYRQQHGTTGWWQPRPRLPLAGKAVAR